ncbi:MAG TPA: alpha/beta hydrolase [Clostridia bacterium]|nr:alpha/beta hydrolase [Clostridia bacterium]
MDFIDIGTAKIAYKVFGSGRINIIIESGISSCCSEWWHIGKELSEAFNILTYDRAGYGCSSQSSMPRTPENIARELYELLSHFETEEKILLIGHSQGGLYVQQFARLFPEIVKGIILIDPLSGKDNLFKELLDPEEYTKSGVNKLKGFKLGQLFTRLRLGFLLVPLLKKGPPFYYYNNFDRDAEEYILSSLKKPMQYRTAIDEYELSHDEKYIAGLKEKSGFPEIPLILFTHTSVTAIEENMHYGGNTRELAEKVETIWQRVMKEYLDFSSLSEWIQAERSSHYIHLTEFELIKKAILKLKGV